MFSWNNTGIMWLNRPGSQVFWKVNVTKWMFLLPKFICWNLILNVMVLGDGAFGRCLCHKGGTLMDKISALIKETLKRALSALLPMRGQREDGRLRTRKQALLRHRVCWRLACVLGLENQETSISAVFKLSVRGDVLQQPEQTRTLEVLYLFPPNF